MPYIDENEFSKTIVKAIDDNRPSGINQRDIKYPGQAGSLQPNNGTHIKVIIDYDTRDRVALGTGEYSIEGELRLLVFSPVNTSMSQHYAAVRAYRQVFDDVDQSFTGGTARFRGTLIETTGENAGMFLTTIICPFVIREIVSNISVSQLAGLTFVEQILLALVTDNESPYLSFDVVAGGAPWITVEDADNPYLTLTVQGGQPLVNNGVRAEAVVDWPFSGGDIVEYEWNIRIPTGFQNDNANGNRWWIMGQWHDKPVGGGEGTGNSPPLSFVFGESSGANYLSFEYLGDTPSALDLIPVPFDTWVKIKVKVWWAETANGKAEVYVNDVLNQTENGANMLNSLSHYFKVGQYRHPDITTNNTVHIDDIRISTVGTFTP